MGTLGKILLFVNLLLAIGLIYLVSLDWTARQKVTQAALQHQLILEGLPVSTDTTKDSEKSVALGFTLEGGERVQTVHPKFLETYFSGANGGTLLGTSGSNGVSSRLGEVKRAQGKLEAHVNGLSPVDKLKFLCGQYSTYAPDRTRPNETARSFTPGLLTRLALTYEERQAIVELLDYFEPLQDGTLQPVASRLQENADQAQELLRKQFERVLNPPNASLASEQAELLAAEKVKFDNALRQNPTDVNESLQEARKGYLKTLRNLDTLATHSEVDRNVQIGHLLVLLDESAEWQKRTALVLGLNDYRVALLEQTDRLDSMGGIAQSFIRLDQAGFDARYSTLLEQARQQQDLVVNQGKRLADLKLLHSDNQELVVARNSQLEGRLAALNEVQQQLTEKLDIQTEVENRLFELQQRFRETLQGNFDLEDKLRQAEESRVGTN